MLLLYASPESLYCAKLRILLRHKQLQWQEVMPDGGCGSSSYREMIPTGTMPAIIDDDLLLADSEAIAEYLEETVPQPAMLPGDTGARARCRERSRFHDTRLEPEVRKLFPYVGSARQGSDIVNRQTDLLNQRLVEFSRLLASDTCLDTSRLTLGDCGFPVSFAWLYAFAPIMELQLEYPQNLSVYRRQIESHAAVVAELNEYAAGMRDWIHTKLAIQ